LFAHGTDQKRRSAPSPASAWIGWLSSDCYSIVMAGRCRVPVRTCATSTRATLKKGGTPDARVARRIFIAGGGDRLPCRRFL